MSGAEAAEMKLLMSGCVPSCVGVIHVCALVHICKFPSYMSVFKKKLFLSLHPLLHNSVHGVY